MSRSISRTKTPPDILSAAYLEGASGKKVSWSLGEKKRESPRTVVILSCDTTRVFCDHENNDIHFLAASVVVVVVVFCRSDENMKSPSMF